MASIFHPCRFTISLIQMGAKGEVQPFVGLDAIQQRLEVEPIGAFRADLTGGTQWGPCPGWDDAPTCPPFPVIIGIDCKWDVDQCGGGPIPLPFSLGNVLAPNPDGEPARAHSMLRFFPDLKSSADTNLGVTTLSMEHGEIGHRLLAGF